MDEGNNLSEDDTRMEEEATTESNKSENAKRVKTENTSLNKSESSDGKTSTSSNAEIETATTSTSTASSGFPKPRNCKNRNYRRSCGDESNDSSNGEG